MKIYHIFLIITLCILIIYTNPSSGLANCKQNGWFPFQCSKNADEVMNLAKKEFDNYNNEKSLSLYKQALKLKPSRPEEVYLYIGINYNMLDKYKKAIGPLSKSIELYPDSSSPYYHRGFAYYKLKEMEKAKQDFKKAIAINKPIYPYEIKESRELLSHIEYLETCE